MFYDVLLKVFVIRSQ